MKSATSHHWLTTLVRTSILLVIVFTTACGNQPKPTPTPMASPTATPPPTPLPPVVVEVLPVPGSEISTSMRWTLVFSEAMNRISVESAFSASPHVSGKFQWTDDQTVTFIPDTQLAVDSAYTLNLAITAQTQAGLALREPFTASYPAATSLRLTDFLPKPDAVDVASDSAIVATFNAPVVPLGESAASSLPAFSISPPVNGTGEWLNTSTYVFHPEPGLAGGIRYTITVNPSLTSTQGAALSGSLASWTFQTAIPKVIGISPTREITWLDDTFEITFNQPMDQQSVEAGWSLTTGSGKSISGKYSWNAKGDTLTFKPDALLPRSDVLTLNLSSDVTSLGGTPLDMPFSATFFTAAPLAITYPQPGRVERFEPYNGYGWIQVSFNAPIDPEEARNKISVTPTVGDLEVSSSENNVYISGLFEPSTNYTIRYPAGTRDIWGGGSQKEQIAQFASADLAPSLSIPMLYYGGRSVFLTPDTTQLPASAAALSSVAFERAPVSFADFVWISQQYSDSIKGYRPEGIQTWGQTIAAGGNTRQAVNLNLTADGKPQEPGLYFYRLQYPSNPSTGDVPAYFTTVVSRVQLTFKLSQTQAFVWAVNMDTNQPVSAAPVVFYDSTGNAIGQCVTDQDGICSVDNLKLGDTYDWDYYYAMLGQPGDSLFSLALSNWRDGISPYDFDVKGSNARQFYLYTERPIYRPGQTVNFRIITRNPSPTGYNLTDYGSVDVTIQSPYSEVNQRQDNLATLTIAMGEYQTGSGSFTLPEDAPVGMYNINIEQEQYSWHSFTVAEYRKPEMELTAHLSADEVKPGEDIKATLNAKYYFGAPVADMEVTWQLYTRSDFVSQPGGYHTGKIDNNWMQGQLRMWSDPRGAYLVSGTGKTAADGTLKVTIPLTGLPDDFDPQMAQTLTWLVNAQEKGGAILTSEDSIQYHPESYTLGAKAGVWGAPAGSKLPIEVRAAGWDDKAIANLPITARFEKVRWTLKSYNRFTAEATYEEITSLTSTINVRTDASGKALLEFTPAEPGTWRLTLTSGKAVTELLNWVGGAGSAGWVSLPNQHLALTADKTSYKPGEDAKVFVPNNLDGAALALVTIERESVLRSQVVRIEGQQAEVGVKINSTDAPNVYASVTLVGREGAKPSFRMGVIDLPVALTEQVFDIQLSANPPEAGPGEEVTLNLQAKDSSGKPVEGEFSLSLVDKAVLALAADTAPGIVEAFYGHRILRVFTSLSLAAYAQRITNMPDLGGGGGGDGIDLSTPGSRTRFADTAFWSGTLKTDSDGLASVTVTLPDNLTTWVAEARGITTDSRVGEAVLELTSSKELLIRPQLPRFVVAGDVLTVSAIVNNNSSANLSVSVDVNLNSGELLAGEQILKTLDIPAKGRTLVGWKVRIQPGSEFKTRFSATAGDLQDVIQPEVIPILNYVSPLSYATSGVLNEAGTRLEVIALPRSYTPQGGELKLEVSPSLAAAVFAGLEALDDEPLGDHPEAVLSRLLPTVEAYQAVTTLGITPPSPVAAYESAIVDAIGRLQRSQKADGGWGWGSQDASNQHLTAYVLYGLSRTEKAGFSVTPSVTSNAIKFLRDRLAAPGMVSNDDDLDDLAFQIFALSEAGEVGLSTAALMDMRDRLSPWAKACLVLAIYNLNAESDSIATLLSDLESSANRTASGASWWADRVNEPMWISPNFVTALVTYALAKLDPASSLVPDAVRFLSLQRGSTGGWRSSYETAWALTALTEVMKGTGELAAAYEYSANLNQTPILAGKADGGTTVKSSQVSVSIDNLRTDGANALEMTRAAGGGRLYYRAYLNLYRLAADAPAISKGMTLTRRYTVLGDDCLEKECAAISTSRLGEGGVTARLTLTLPRDMYNVVVEDVPPSGMEVFNPALNINQGYIINPEENPAPTGDGWGMWWFSPAEIHDDLVRWSAGYLPAGTYELVYQMTPFAAGEFQVVPARAWQYYFPEVQAATAGSIFTIIE